MHQDKNPKLLDFGCSWGYGSYQLSKSDLILKVMKYLKVEVDMQKKS